MIGRYVALQAIWRKLFIQSPCYGTSGLNMGGSSSDGRLQYSSNYYASEDDLRMIEEFYKVNHLWTMMTMIDELWNQDKDTSKYNLALAQALDSIRSSAAYVAVSAEYCECTTMDYWESISEVYWWFVGMEDEITPDDRAYIMDKA